MYMCICNNNTIYNYTVFLMLSVTQCYTVSGMCQGGCASYVHCLEFHLRYRLQYINPCVYFVSR